MAPISMQGNWAVSVKSRSAAFPQRFVIAGAVSGNGAHDGQVSAPPIAVTGDNWTINIQSNPGSGFVNSETQIKFPTASTTHYELDIESNDAGPDEDFNDLVLMCTTPKTATDFVVYGHAGYYGPGCIFNPCWRDFVVIDTVASLEEALGNAIVRPSIEKLYPDRLRVEIPPIGPTPPPPPFRPLMIPLQGESAIPAKQAQILTLAQHTPEEPKRRAKGPAAEPQQVVTSARSLTISKPAPANLDFDRVGVARLVDRLQSLCRRGPLPGVFLRFLEYDRTAAELAGGPYTGTGDREVLGTCFTDRNGNYVFRFTRSIGDIAEEVSADVAVGENAVVQARPDVIVQLLDPSAPTGVCHESAPYWNIPLLRRINLCIPRECVGRLPGPCDDGQVIEGVGNISFGPRDVDLSRSGHNNFLTSDGRVTAKNTGQGVPHARCAAWAGVLDLYGCFANDEVTRYTLRWRRPAEGYQFFQEPYRHPKLGSPNPNGELVGPFDVTLNVPGLGTTLAKAYSNIEDDESWAQMHRGRKAFISSWVYAPTPGPVKFRIDGYDAAGNSVASDSMWLWIDNLPPELQISSVDMQGQLGGDCALFTVPPGDPATPLTVRFKASQPRRFMNGYALSVRKGNMGGFPITGTGPGQLSGEYVHGDDLVCNSFDGTPDDPAADASGFVVADIVPGPTAPASGRWLQPGQPFCTFSVNVACSVRVTNGYNSAVQSYGPAQYLLGIQA